MVHIIVMDSWSLIFKGNYEVNYLFDALDWLCEEDMFNKAM